MKKEIEPIYEFLDEKATWAANVGEIRALNELSMTLKTK